MTVNPSLASACSAHLSPHSPALQLCMRAKQFLSCPTLCNPMDCSPPGPSVYGDSPRKYTGVGCTPSSRGYFWPRDRIYVSYISCIGRQIFFFFFFTTSTTWKPVLKPTSKNSAPCPSCMDVSHPHRSWALQQPPSAQLSSPCWWILPQDSLGVQDLHYQRRQQKIKDHGLCLTLGFPQTDSQVRSCVQKAYWGVLSGNTPVTGQRHKLTHSELQLVSQQIPQRALDLRWPLRSIQMREDGWALILPHGHKAPS